MASKKERVRKRGPRGASAPSAAATVSANGGPADPASLSPEELLRMPHAYLIRIPQRPDRVRALVALMHVPRAYCCFRDHRYLVTQEHLLVLQKAGIPFEDITDAT